MFEYQNTIIREPLETDVKNYIYLRNSVEIQKNLMSRIRPNSVEKVKKWLVDKNSNENSALFTIANAKSNEFVGYIQISNIQFLNRSCYIGIFIDEEHRGQSYASNALYLIEKYAIEVLNLKKVILEVLVDNVTAINLYKKNNYQEVGKLKEHFYFNEAYLDVLIMEKIIR
jgi:RimJ/RimL family protein N-acetyltransferase